MFMSSFKWGRGATGSSGVDAVGCNGGGSPSVAPVVGLWWQRSLSTKAEGDGTLGLPWTAILTFLSVWFGEKIKVLLTMPETAA